MITTRVLKTDVPVGGFSYRIHAMSTMLQYHVSSKLSTVLLGLTSIKAQDKELPAARFGRALLAMSGSLSDEDREFCLNACLEVVERKQGQTTSWAPITAGGKPMFEDIDLLQTLELMYDVLDAHGMPSFFAAPPATSGQGEKPTE